MISPLLAVALLAGPAVAAVGACDRLTHAVHGGDRDNSDMGAGKVMWVSWWEHEGVKEDVWLTDCRTGIALSIRAREDGVGDRTIKARTGEIVAELKRQVEAAPAFFTIERMARHVRAMGVDLSVAQYDDEFCACAAAYPDMRGSKVPFDEVPS